MESEHQQNLEHDTEHGGQCWCEPELIYEDTESGDRLWLHRRTDN